MTRATGGTLPTSEDQINRVAVAIFNSGGTVNVIQEFTDVSKAVTVNCTQGMECTGIVVANAPSGHFAGIMKKDDFIKKTVDLSQTQASGNLTQDANNLPMSGEIKVSSKTSFDIGSATVTASAEVSRLVARVAITNIKTAFDANGQYKAATFKIKKIFLHNATSTSTVGTGVPTTTLPISGKTDTENKYLQNAISDVAVTSAGYTTSYWFYTFANTAAGMTSKHTKLVIYEEFDPDGAGGIDHSDVYYPVVINKLQRESSLKRSDQYHHRYSRQR